MKNLKKKINETHENLKPFLQLQKMLKLVKDIYKLVRFIIDVAGIISFPFWVWYADKGQDIIIF